MNIASTADLTRLAKQTVKNLAQVTQEQLVNPKHQCDVLAERLGAPYGVHLLRASGELQEARLFVVLGEAVPLAVKWVHDSWPTLCRNFSPRVIEVLNQCSYIVPTLAHGPSTESTTGLEFLAWAYPFQQGNTLETLPISEHPTQRLMDFRACL